MAVPGRTSTTRPHLLLAFALAGAAAACGQDGGASGGGRQASYQTLSLQVLSPAPGQPLYPGDDVLYELDYRGDLCNPPQFSFAITHEPTGETTRVPVAANGTQQDFTFRLKSRWRVRHEALKRAGRFRVETEVTLQPTLRGSRPFVATAAPVFIELATAIDAVRVVSPASPVAYGTPLEVQVDGRDLWEDVVLTAVDAAGAPVPELETKLPFLRTATSGRHSWTISARALERVGSHDIELVASFGPTVSARSAPLTLVLTHTIDSASVELRDLAGALRPAGSSAARLQEVRALVARARGTHLAGHEVTVNGGNRFVAAADEVELVQAVSDRDFASGKGTRRYDFVFRSGGVERAASASLQRWGITSCGWFTADGRPLAEATIVQAGTPVVMRATTWGFPDTRTTLGIFKDREANFAIKESDAGRHLLLGPGPDDVDDFDADIRGDASEHGWTARHDEDTPLPVPLVPTYAELFFDVTIEDQGCRSAVIKVPKVYPLP